MILIIFLLRKQLCIILGGGGTQSQFLKISLGTPKTSSDYEVFWYTLIKLPPGFVWECFLLLTQLETFG